MLKKKKINVSQKKDLHKDAKIERIALSRKIKDLKIKSKDINLELVRTEEQKREAVKLERKRKTDYLNALEQEIKLKKNKNGFIKFMNLIGKKLKNIGKKKKKKN